MSIEHKAYSFDFDEFSKELKPILEASIKSGDIDQLRAFIISNKPYLSDPYEGEPLGDDWEDMVEERDAHQYGDFALTKYYSPDSDQGLGYDWEKVQDILSGSMELHISPLLGRPLGEPGEYFDPGKMGSYFQDNSQVESSIRVLEKLKDCFSGELRGAIGEFHEFLENVSDEGKGIYVTF
jgi:hypothetical protein